MGEKKPGFCHLCGERIHGSYTLYNHKLVVCEQCNRSLPRCSRCNTPSRTLIKVRDGAICPQCQQTAPICGLCQQPVLKNYLTYSNGLIVCEYCNHTVQHCSRCNIPSKQLRKVRDSLICPDCLKGLTACKSCHIPILSNYVVIGDSPARYCETCMSTRPRCDLCTVPLDEQGKILQGQSGEIRRCAECYSTAVKTDAEATRLYAEMHRMLKQELNLEVPLLPALQLVERKKLIQLHRAADQLMGTQSNSNPDPAQHLLGFFQRHNSDRNIYIEHMLPQTLYKAVAAHELAHAWQSDHAPKGQPPQIIEGFAEWVAYTILLKQGYQREAARLTRRDDIYGKGLQYFIALERQQGRNAVLQRAMQK